MRALRQFLAHSPWTIHHKALIIFQKSKKHHRKIVNYRVAEKGDFKHVDAYSLQFDH